jgi:hypothetical protein
LRQWNDLSQGARDLFRRPRSSEGERMILDENVFGEVALRERRPRSTDRGLDRGSGASRFVSGADGGEDEASLLSVPGVARHQRDISG